MSSFDYDSFVEELGEGVDLRNDTKSSIKQVFYALMVSDTEFRNLILDLIHETIHDKNTARLLIKQYILNNMGDPDYIQDSDMINNTRVLLARAASLNDEFKDIDVSPDLVERAIYAKGVELYTMHILDDYVTHAQLEYSFKDEL